jgi:hypothetical protein
MKKNERWPTIALNIFKVHTEFILLLLIVISSLDFRVLFLLKEII